MNFIKMHWWRLLIAFLVIVLWVVIVLIWSSFFENEDLELLVGIVLSMGGAVMVGWITAQWIIINDG